MIFNKFSLLGNQHRNPVLDQLRHLSKILLSHLQLISIATHSPDHHDSTFCLYRFTSSEQFI